METIKRLWSVFKNQWIWIVIGAVVTLDFLAGLDSARKNASQLELVLENQKIIQESEKRIIENQETLAELKKTLLSIKKIAQEKDGH